MMKKNKFILSAATGLLLVGLAGVKASAEEETNYGKDSTETTVTIKDKDGNDDKPGEDELVLKHVPDGFHFKTALKNESYSITTEDTADITGDNTIKVFNNYSGREWQVKASIENEKFERKKINDTFVVTNFEINDVKIGIGTGKSGVVHSNKAVKDIAADKSNLDEYVGTIPKNVTKIKIEFNDPDNKLKVADELKGEVNYTLGLTPTDVQ